MHENRHVVALEQAAQVSLRETEELLVQRNRLAEQHRSIGGYVSLLQSSHSVEEAMAMTANVITELLPDAGGRCYVLRASQNFAESAAHFGYEALPSLDMLQPSQCWALRRGQPYRSAPPQNLLRCTHYAETTENSEAWTHCVPLLAQGANLGLLHLSGTRPTDDADHAVIEAIGEQLSLALVNLHLRETLRMQSLRDPLTGLFNRRSLEDGLERELQRCHRRKLPLSVLMLDVDHFKQFNDAHGHPAGDALLARLGQLLRDVTRNEDIACRYGGEEFMLVLPEASADDAARRAEDIRAAIAGTTIMHMRRTLGPVTASIGIATFPADGESALRLVEAADSALYRAKAGGRDRVVVSG